MDRGGPWYSAAIPKEDMAQVWADTWHAMEDVLREGKVRSLYVLNFTVKHLETLKKCHNMASSGKSGGVPSTLSPGGSLTVL